jgi:DNA-binding response OmpR family regulator
MGENTMEQYKILIIDDDREVAETISMFLEEKGYRTLQAHDVTGETYEFIRTENPDLIILDIVLPSQDGIDVLKKLKSDKATADIPVIICSVVRRKKRVVEGLDAGAVDFLTKPFEVEELYARVGSALMVHEIRREEDHVERLETLRRLAVTVAEEIQAPLLEMRRHVESLRGCPAIAETDGAEIVAGVAQSLDEIERILERFQKGPARLGE